MSESDQEKSTKSKKKGGSDGEARSKKAPPARSSGRPLVGELDEDAINAPTKQTLLVMGILSISTLLMWAAGRAACNYRVPGESLTPRTVSLEERTTTAKRVGFEFNHALAGGDFETASKLAHGDALALVEKEKAACGACEQRVAARDDLRSLAIVTKAHGADSIVDVKTWGPEGETRRILGVERVERQWRVSRVFENLESAKLKEAPIPQDAPFSLRRVTPEEEAKTPPGSPSATGDEKPHGTKPGAPTLPAGHPTVPSPKPAPSPNAQPAPQPAPAPAPAAATPPAPSPAPADP